VRVFWRVHVRVRPIRGPARIRARTKHQVPCRGRTTISGSVRFPQACVFADVYARASCAYVQSERILVRTLVHTQTHVHVLVRTSNTKELLQILESSLVQHKIPTIQRPAPPAVNLALRKVMEIRSGPSKSLLAMACVYSYRALPDTT